MSFFLSCLCYCYFFFTAALLFFALVLITPIALIFDKNRSFIHYLTNLWGYHFVKINPLWRCRIEGAEHLEQGKNYVIVANHQSLADVFVLAGLKHHFKWVSKESLLKIPFFGWNMRLNNYVALKRGDRKSIKEMMNDCKQWLKNGVSIMMFPEGTRSEDGRIGEFRDGSFKLALECNVPLVPVVITGTREVISKHSRKFNFAGEMMVMVLPPVSPSEFQGRPGQMREHVRNLMVHTLSCLAQD